MLNPSALFTSWPVFKHHHKAFHLSYIPQKSLHPGNFFYLRTLPVTQQLWVQLFLPYIFTVVISACKNPFVPATDTAKNLKDRDEFPPRPSHFGAILQSHLQNLFA